MIIQAAQPEHFGWLTERTGYIPGGDFRAIEAVHDGRILAMVGYDNWLWTSARAHIAVDVPVRSILRPAFSYPFEEAGRRILLGQVSAGNEKSLRLAKHLGFREVYRTRDGAAEGQDLVFLEMRKEDCRWLYAARKAA